MSRSIKHRRKFSIPFIFCGAFLPMLVSAETSAWKTVGAWDISFYPNTGGCLAYTVYDGGVAFFVGLSKYDEILSFDMTLMNDKWVSIEDKKEYEVVVTLGNEVPWTLEMTGIKFEKTWGMSFSTPANSEKAGRFVDEFMREVAMEWTYNGRQLGYLSLSDSRLAFEEAVSCTKSFQDAIKGSSDPFATGVNNESMDPFAN
jgi:hypothetical protein